MLENSDQKTAAIYVRVSTTEQAKEGFSIDAQVETLTQYCKMYNLDIYKTYKDEGISGKNVKDRPALNQLLLDAKKGLFNSVAVWKVSRLSRNLKDLLIIVDDLRKHNVDFISFSERFDTSHPAGRMTLSILGSIAEFERNTIVENVKLGLHQRAKDGNWTNNHVYGYDNKNKQLQVNEEEAKIVKRIYDMYLNQNLGMFKIAQALNLEGIKTKRSGMFAKDYIYRILTNPVYCGLVRHNLKSKDYYEVQGIHTPIIDIETFEMVKAKISKKSIGMQRKANSFTLIGIIKCKQCGSSMVSSYSSFNGQKYRYYRCSKNHRYGSQACSPNMVNADQIERAVLEKIMYVISNEDIIRGVIADIKTKTTQDIEPTQEVIESIESEINKQNKLIEKYLKLYEYDEMPGNILSAKIKEIQEKISELINQKNEHIEKLNSYDLTITDDDIINSLRNFIEIFDLADPEDQRMLLQSLIEKINLNDDKSLKSIELKFPIGNDVITI